MFSGFTFLLFIDDDAFLFLPNNKPIVCLLLLLLLSVSRARRAGSFSLFFFVSHFERKGRGFAGSFFLFRVYFKVTATLKGHFSSKKKAGGGNRIIKKESATNKVTRGDIIRHTHYGDVGTTRILGHDH